MEVVGRGSWTYDMFFLNSNKRNYNKSNRITAVAFEVNDCVCALCEEILGARSARARQKFSTSLLDELCDLAQIDICNVKISDTNQYHKKRGGRTVMKQYGYYRPKSKYIYITNRTAVRGQMLASKTFLNTLLHEWMHHYDFCALGLNSIHSAGFYKRLGELQKVLLRG